MQRRTVKKLHWLFSCIAISMASMAQATDALSVFNTQYTAKLYGFSIDVTSRLTASSNNHYELYFNAEALFGSITEISQLQWNAEDQTVIPHHYLYNRSGLGKSSEEELNFDWTKHTISNPHKKTNWPMLGALKIQDSLSYQLQLRQDLLAGKKDFYYPISNGKKIKEYRFEIVGEEILNTPLGDVNTVKVKRSYTNDDRETFVWFAKNFQYLLVRLQQEENGSAYTIYISKASLNGKALEHF